MTPGRIAELRAAYPRTNKSGCSVQMNECLDEVERLREMIKEVFHATYAADADSDLRIPYGVIAKLRRELS